jgi:hypothetical protein
VKFVRTITTAAAALAVALAATGCTGADTAPTTTSTAAAVTSSPSVTATGPAPSPTASPTSSPSTTTAEAASSSPSVTPPAQAEAAKKTASAGTALAALESLPVKGRAPKTGYDRDHFGPAWTDTDRNGCDTRNDILNRDLTTKQWRPGTHDCVVIVGTVADPYTGRTLQFLKEVAIAVQIDHVVALSDAWQKGAQQLTAVERLRFANDPVNLFAVDGPTNASKRDGDAATWLPPNQAFRCPYAAHQIAAKAKYRLWVTSAERDALRRVLGECPDEKLPVSAS